MYPILTAGSKIIADDRLYRLRYGIVYHEYNGKEITDNAESGYSVFTQMTDKYIIA